MTTITKNVIGRITDVDVEIDTHGNILPITLRFDREDGGNQAATFEYDSNFRAFMKACDAETTQDLIGTMCRIDLTDEINPVISNVYNIFGRDRIKLSIY